MSTSLIINLVDTDDEEFYRDLETQRAILNSNDSSTTPVIIDLVDTDDDESHLDIKAQRLVLLGVVLRHVIVKEWLCRRCH
ncbi:hypothetical protein BGX27_001676 [Mortierella sp. AM989]|nr:hypothetical protein BGX27_001676 [Mortierella sp. AM989]